MCMHAGLIVALCLQRVFGVPFLASSDSGGAERFNVYGPVRLLTHAIDDWYKQAKPAFVPSVFTGSPVATAIFSSHVAYRHRHIYPNLHLNDSTYAGPSPTARLKDGLASLMSHAARGVDEMGIQCYCSYGGRGSDPGAFISSLAPPSSPSPPPPLSISRFAISFHYVLRRHEARNHFCYSIWN